MSRLAESAVPSCFERQARLTLGGHSKLRSSRERSHSRATSLKDSMREHWRGLDGAYTLAGEECQQGPFGVAGWQPIMSGIKERILGLRKRANTAPARLEHAVGGPRRPGTLRGRGSIL